MASSLEAARPSTAACSNGMDIELTFLDELRRVSVLMAATRACCKEAALTSASTSEAAAPADGAAWWDLGWGVGKRGYGGEGMQTVMELPGGEKLLSRRVAEIEEEGLPLFGIEATKRFGERGGTANFEGGGWRFYDGLGDFEPERQFAQEKNLRASG